MKIFSNILLSIQKNGIARIILNESKTYNALSSDTLKSLLKIF